MTGPLQGLRVLEFVGLGPCPFAAMLLADLGADVIRIERKQLPGVPNPYPVLGTRYDVMARSRRSLALDLKHPEGRMLALDLVAQADVLLEGFRPGVMERLGLGPDVSLERNPRLVYTRVTGWGQEGPLASAAGHDLNYIALSGVLPSMGRPGSPPPPPLNLIGDFGAGGMMAAFGTVSGVLHARRTGEGQVVDAAMLDGTNLMSAMIYGFHAMGGWSGERGRNWIDGGAPYYDTYECADGKWIAIGPIEPQFLALLLRLCGVEDPQFGHVQDVEQWPQLKVKMAAVFRGRTRAQWCELLEGTDACFSPVLDLDEAPAHPHNRARENFIEIAGVVQPAPAPRFQRTPASISRPPDLPGEHGVEILNDWSIDRERVDWLRDAGVI
ncbi:MULTISPECIES: CaiB/BaiF CoA transferase family protein [Cupriavidus]|uniref:Alpha-methylacyl-CoA racemase n=2 Tax=Cupriavidus TaxID=106589 RepID=A0A7W4VEN7_9BURK|nr:MULTISPECIES: CaiB/BaiF CoA-transferase family protein [Cupriavidus]MBB3009894.1 alpha-methylacyl-CoA racemase [Cupriavidus alkaliphilus]QBY56230.1 CoA transferase [Cupriavidus oxalaticus]